MEKTSAKFSRVGVCYMHDKLSAYGYTYYLHPSNMTAPKYLTDKVYSTLHYCVLVL